VLGGCIPSAALLCGYGSAVQNATNAVERERLETSLAKKRSVNFIQSFFFLYYKYKAPIPNPQPYPCKG